MNRYGQRAEGTNIYICLKPEDHHPYAHPEMVVTGEVLGELLKRGESAYPDAPDTTTEARWMRQTG